MTRGEALKEYKEIRKRAQNERVDSAVPRGAMDICLSQHGWNPPLPDTIEPPQSRKIYLRCFERVHNSAFDAFVKNLLTSKGIAKPTPIQWVKAAIIAPFRCGRCAGTGMFITYVENGIPKGPGGICFRCAGKGYQTDEDAKRNYWHDLHYVPPGM